jgi:hypothetical protein
VACRCKRAIRSIKRTFAGGLLSELSRLCGRGLCHNKEKSDGFSVMEKDQILCRGDREGAE